MKNNASLLYGFFLVIGDSLALIAAFVAAYVLRVSLDTRPTAEQIPSKEYLKAFVILLPFWLIIFGLLGLYNKNTYTKRFAEMGRIFTGSFVGILFIISYSFMVDKAIFPARLVPVYGLGLALFSLLLFRSLARAIRKYLFHRGIGINNVLVIGNTPATEEMVHSLSNTRVTGYKVISVVGSKSLKLDDLPVPRIYESFSEAIHNLRGRQLHSIIQTELYAAPEKNNEILTYAQENHISYRFVPGNSELFVGNIEVDLFQSIPVIAVHQTALIGWGRIVKRLFDLSVALVLATLTLPLMILIALIYYVTDHGDPVFGQTRLGRFGTKFKIYKFRTYKHAYNRMSPEEGFAKMGRPELATQYRENGDFLEDDPRISRFGRFLRRTSLDELPQFFNVIKGDLSLVGPRALEPFELEKYSKKNLILSVKTGLTGLAVISGRRNIPFEERRKLDLYYVQNWSFWGDIVILARTISVVLFHRGAR